MSNSRATAPNSTRSAVAVDGITVTNGAIRTSDPSAEAETEVVFVVAPFAFGALDTGAGAAPDAVPMSGHGIPAAQAAEWIADANRIRTVLAC